MTHRYQRLHDHLLSCFIHQVKHFSDEAKAAANEQVTTQWLQQNADVPKAGTILQLFTSEAIDPDARFHTVQAQAFAILERDRLARVAEYIATKATIDELAFHWQHVDKMALRFKRHLRPLLQVLAFAAVQKQALLLQAIHVLKATFHDTRSLSKVDPARLPSRCIPVRLKRYLYRQDETKHKQFIPDRYEFLVYQRIRKALEAGDLFCRDSVRFRSFEDDLLSDEQWEHKAALIEMTGSQILAQPIDTHLAELEAELEAQLIAVNTRVRDGANPHFSIKGRGDRTRFLLEYPRQNDEVNHTVFDTLRQVDLSSVLSFVNGQCGFLAKFDYVLGRYTKRDVDEQIISAGLIAWGTNMGLGRMGDISDIPYQTLARTSDNFIRLETLKAANDQVSNATAALPMMRHYNLVAVVHSSSDGQKFETDLHTINARHSPKYFGLNKGVVAYTLVANP